MKNLTPRDIHPGDYVFVSLYFREDGVQDAMIPIKVDVVADNYIATKNGAGLTKYAWTEVYPILLTEDHLARLGWTKISPEHHEDYAIFADGKVTVDVVKVDSNNDDIEWPGSVYYNDGDAHDANYVHELQDIVYKLSGGDWTPEFNTYIWIAGDIYYSHAYKKSFGLDLNKKNTQEQA